MRRTQRQIYILGLLLLLMVDVLYPSGGNANQRSKLKNNNVIYNKSTSAIEFFTGTFYKGKYTFKSKRDNSWNTCNSMTFCDIDKNMFGTLYGMKHTKRYFKFSKSTIDIDNSILYGTQSPQLSETNKILNYKGGEQKSFFLLSVIPTYRYYIPVKDTYLNLGIGGGLNYAINQIPSEYPTSNKLNSQINFEIGYGLDKSNSIDLVLNLQHRCTLFGLFEGKLRGRQWYTMGIRKWL